MNNSIFFITLPQIAKYLILLCFPILYLGSNNVRAQECYTQSQSVLSKQNNSSSSDCLDFIDLGESINWPLVNVKLYFHFVDDHRTGENFHDDPTGEIALFAPEWIKGFVYNINYLGQHFVTNENSIINVDAVGDGRVRLTAYSSDTDVGYRFYNDVDEIDNQNLNPDYLHLIFTSRNSGWGGHAASIGGKENYFYFDNIVNERITPWSARGVFWHEFGHNLGLYHVEDGEICNNYDVTCAAECDASGACHHTDFGTLCGNTSNNLMHGSARADDTFSPCQWSVVYSSLAFYDLAYTDLYIHPSVSTLGNPEIVQSSDNNPIIWDLPRSLLGDVIVKSGTTLSINTTVLLYPKVKLIVERGAKLILDGACIDQAFDIPFDDETSDNYWGGIEIWGNTAVPHRPNMHIGTLTSNDPGVVWIKNFTSISGANPAIVTQRSGAIPWEQKKTYFGGYIYATDSEFINNRRSIEFMSYHHPNLSYFEDVVFEADIDQIGQVSIWDTEGITFRNCHFEDKDPGTDDFAILTVDGSFKAFEECLFKGYEQAINIMGTVPFVQEVEIGDDDYDPNLFIENESAIVINTAKDIFIENNSFEKGRMGISIDGESSFQILRNGFYNFERDGIRCQDTGHGDNDIKENIFQDVRSGIDIRDHNKLLQFNLNCFNTRNNDIFALIRGRFDEFPSQGGSGRPAFNTFTEGRNQFNLYLRYNEPVDYFHWDNPNLDPRFIPTCDQNSTCSSQDDFFNVSTSSLNTSDLNLCIPIIPGYEEPEECITKECLKEYRDNIAQLEKELEKYISEGGKGDKVDESTAHKISVLKAELVYWQKKKIATLNGLIRSWKADGKFDAIEKILTADGEKPALQKLVGLMIYIEEYAKARSVLVNIPHNEEGDAEFELIQMINIDRAQNGIDYKPSEEDKKSLTSIANGDNRVAGYAKSLHTLLYGTYWPIEEEEEIGFRSQESIADLQNVSTNWKIMNPMSGFLQINRPIEYSDQELKVRLISISGQEILADRWSSESGIYKKGLSNVANGVYILEIILDNNRILTQKVIIQN